VRLKTDTLFYPSQGKSGRRRVLLRTPSRRPDSFPVDKAERTALDELWEGGAWALVGVPGANGVAGVHGERDGGNFSGGEIQKRVREVRRAGEKRARVMMGSTLGV
jgi:hypothetical protein